MLRGGCLLGFGQRVKGVYVERMVVQERRGFS
jgi:hypothetical protein